jgi:hypothetical protein
MVRIEFLDEAGNVIREWSASPKTVEDEIDLIVEADWPPRTRSKF